MLLLRVLEISKKSCENIVKGRRVIVPTLDLPGVATCGITSHYVLLYFTRCSVYTQLRTSCGSTYGRPQYVIKTLLETVNIYFKYKSSFIVVLVCLVHLLVFIFHYEENISTWS